MEITVTFDGHSWRVRPDPAVVQVGSPVVWRFRTSGAPLAALRWVVYFDHGSPFVSGAIRFVVTTRALAAGAAGLGDHEGMSEPVHPSEPGDYKYGVRVDDPARGNTLSEDDPRLIVTP